MHVSNHVIIINKILGTFLYNVIICYQLVYIILFINPLNYFHRSIYKGVVACVVFMTLLVWSLWLLLDKSMYTFHNEVYTKECFEECFCGGHSCPFDATSLFWTYFIMLSFSEHIFIVQEYKQASENAPTTIIERIDPAFLQSDVMLLRNSAIVKHFSIVNVAIKHQKHTKWIL